ncbi:hypothetical protein Mag101_13795 [Microbulbifer agarilyticus]|uniref:Uncharacterized protein n=1 Tax=Microbulbifer agarilyticus TaxID=260552 RepID=A0A1Q2M7D1_9GAMM|nr:hypothetical protein Mag101_13795 [Microbulbifer agarilyticus]
MSVRCKALALHLAGREFNAEFKVEPVSGTSGSQPAVFRRTALFSIPSLVSTELLISENRFSGHLWW